MTWVAVEHLPHVLGITPNRSPHILLEKDRRKLDKDSAEVPCHLRSFSDSWEGFVVAMKDPDPKKNLKRGATPL